MNDKVKQRETTRNQSKKNKEWSKSNHNKIYENGYDIT